jgi:predicted acetyltransferase
LLLIDMTSRTKPGAVMPTIEMQEARPGDKDTLANLMQLYMHDFSEHWSGTSNGDLLDDGRFAPYPRLDAYWQEPGRVPLLLRHDGRLAGFALINGVSADSPHRSVGEFFIVRKHRRIGLGAAAAHAIFSRYPGQWQTAVARRNVDALAFWRNAVSRHPDVEDIEMLDLNSAEWDGPVIRFRIRPS